MTSSMLTTAPALMSKSRWQAAGVVTFVVAGFLLLSFGGAVAAAPVTLPLMFLSSRKHPTRSFRIAAVAIGSLTAAEVGWAATYLVLGDARPWIWLVPIAAAAGWIFIKPGRPAPAT